MATRMQQRRGTAQQWTDENPVLAEGEVGFETDTYQFKIGNGVNQWASLDYFSAGVDLSAYATESYVDTAVSNIVDSAPGVLDTLNELAAAIGDDANFVTTVNSNITNGDSATLASAQSYADTQDAALSATLTAAYEAYADGATTDMATTTYVDAQDATTLAAANAYTDSEITTLDTSLKSYADQAEADAKSYTDAEIAAIPAPDLSSYATKAYADQAEADAKSYADTEIANLVDSSPAALNTLNELAAALGDDPNFATTVTNQIADKASVTYVDSEIAGRAPLSHTHPISDVTNLQTELNGKSDTGHGHAISDVTNLQSTLDGKAASSHTHAISEVTNLQTSLDAKVNKTNPTVNAASETAYYVRNIYISSSDTPSGGNDGDLWVTWE